MGVGFHFHLFRSSFKPRRPDRARRPLQHLPLPKGFSQSGQNSVQIYGYGGMLVALELLTWLQCLEHAICLVCVSLCSAHCTSHNNSTVLTSTLSGFISFPLVVSLLGNIKKKHSLGHALWGKGNESIHRGFGLHFVMRCGGIWLSRGCTGRYKIGGAFVAEKHAASSGVKASHDASGTA